MADAARLPFKDRSFDFLVSRAVYEHVVEIQSALEEAQRVARRGAIIVPSALWEMFNPQPGHLWLVSEEGGGFVFRPKTRFWECEHVRTIAEKGGDRRKVLRHMERANEFYQVVIRWEEGFTFRVEGRAPTDLPEQQKAGDSAAATRAMRPLLRVRYFTKHLVSRCYRRVAKRISFNLESLLACPSCRAGLTKTEGNYQCDICGRLFPSVGGIPRLII